MALEPSGGSAPSPSLSGMQNTAIVARLAGFTGSALTTIVAIAGCESGYNPTEINNNPSTGDYSVGLFQINYFGSLLGPRTAAYGSPSDLQTDPLAQAKAAYSISGGGANFTPWTTYTSGCYKKNLSAASAAVASTANMNVANWQAGSAQTNAELTAASAGSGTASTDTSTSNGCIISWPSVAGLGGGCALSQSQARALLGGVSIAGGGIIFLLGLALLASHTGVAKQAIQFTGPVGTTLSRANTSMGAVKSRFPDADDRNPHANERGPSAEDRAAYNRAKRGTSYRTSGSRIVEEPF